MNFLRLVPCNPSLQLRKHEMEVGLGRLGLSLSLDLYMDLRAQMNFGLC